MCRIKPSLLHTVDGIAGVQIDTGNKANTAAGRPMQFVGTDLVEVFDGHNLRKVSCVMHKGINGRK